MATIWQQPTIWKRKRYGTADTDGGLSDRIMLTRMRYQWSGPVLPSTKPVPPVKKTANPANPARTGRTGRGIQYRGHTFPGYNEPVRSYRPGKKMMVLVKKGGEVRLIHFGDSRYGHNYSAEARKSYLKRSAGIVGADDPFSANYWARRVLWAGPGGSVARPPKQRKAKS